MNTSRAVVDVLEARGVECVYGYPGGRAIELLEDLPDSSIAFMSRDAEGGARPRSLLRRLRVLVNPHLERDAHPGLRDGVRLAELALLTSSASSVRVGTSPRKCGIARWTARGQPTSCARE